MRERNADGADFLFAIRRVDGHQTGGFRQTVAFTNRHPSSFFKPAIEFQRQWCRTTEREAQCRDIGIHLALHQCRHGRWHRDHKRRLVALDQLPEIVKDPVASIPLRCGEHDLRARPQRRSKRNNRREHMEHWKGAHLHVILGKEQSVAKPSVVDDPRISVLRHFRHAGCATRMKIRGDPIFCRVRKGQLFRLFVHLRHKIEHLSVVLYRVLWPDQRNDKLLQTSEVTEQINFQNRFHVWCHSQSFRSLWRHVSLRESL